ncbi:MAG: hypothetical protein IPJ03_22365 [Ignavibacteriales bacterium]|nr:hypothetical protein [Ignavibacteriales bacterium]
MKKNNYICNAMIQNSQILNGSNLARIPTSIIALAGGEPYLFGDTMYKGFKHTVETKEKIRLAHIGKKFTEETKKKMSLAHIGLKHNNSPKGEKHHRWKGDNTSYGKIHLWIEKNWEKPDHCEHCNKKRKLDWANISKEYKRSDRNDWIALCRSCHVKMDWTKERSERMSDQQKKYANSDIGRARLSKIAKEYWSKKPLQIKLGA